jgi:hypothetical protein
MIRHLVEAFTRIASFDAFTPILWRTAPRKRQKSGRSKNRPAKGLWDKDMSWVSNGLDKL